jgi:competence protein ComEA
MATGKLNRFWVLIVILLAVIIIFSSVVIWLRYIPNQPVEISLPKSQEWEGNIYIVGAVNNPGIYPFLSKDSIEMLIQTAGKTTSSANLNGLKLYIPEAGEEQEVQKIDINRAEVWLLEALPGIGEILAQRIVDYRRQNGPFHNIYDLLKVADIGDKTFNLIKDLITVTD